MCSHRILLNLLPKRLGVQVLPPALSGASLFQAPSLALPSWAHPCPHCRSCSPQTHVGRSHARCKPSVRSHAPGPRSPAPSLSLRSLSSPHCCISAGQSFSGHIGHSTKQHEPDRPWDKGKKGGIQELELPPCREGWGRQTRKSLCSVFGFSRRSGQAAVRCSG